MSNRKRRSAPGGPEVRTPLAIESQDQKALWELMNDIPFDLRGISAALWTIAQGCGDREGCIADGTVHMALHYMQDRLDKEAARIEELASQVWLKGPAT